MNTLLKKHQEALEGMIETHEKQMQYNIDVYLKLMDTLVKQHADTIEESLKDFSNNN